ncbi:hypothetical protein ACM9HB_34610, partial [Streptomyces sp. JAC128]|uniref:hypothetical protein n=1 Tax=Streptomyces sp. JAC128 TaxID=3418412 RepID=UPI003D817E4B
MSCRGAEFVAVRRTPVHHPNRATNREDTMLQFTDQEIQAKAEELGLVKPGETTAAMRSRVVAA